MMHYLLWLVYLPSVFFIFYSLIHDRVEEEPVRDKIEKSRHIAGFGAAASLDDRLRLRAGPNAAVAKMFGIENSFTTTDRDVHHRFLKRAVGVIQGVDKGTWISIRDLSDRILTTMAPPDADHGGISIERVSRVVCFHIVLQLINADFETPVIDVDNADWITDNINRLWLESKLQNKPSLAGQNETLMELRFRLANMTRGNDEDPLALTIPMYETLWRVVMLTYIHTAFRHIDQVTQGTLQDVVQNVTNPQDAHFDEVTARFSTEALRLYPPTKRIYRHGGTASDATTEAADVESLHHDKRIWGLDALEFRPSRLVHQSRDQRDAYMPFGVGRNTCPASRGFAGNMISLLVAVLVRRLGTLETGARISFGDKLLDGDVLAPLPTGRAASKGWVIYPRSQDQTL